MRAVSVRLCLLVLMIVVEALAISISFDARLPQETLERSGSSWMTHAGIAPKLLIIWFAALLVAQGPKLKEWRQQLQRAASGHLYVKPLALHLCAYLLLFAVTYLIFGESSAWGGSGNGLPLIWIASLTSVAVLWLNALAPFEFWLRFSRAEGLSIGFACLIAILTWAFALVTQDLWDPLSAGTFSATTALLELFYSDVVVEPEHHLLGVGSFVVEIAAVCSGYEGIGLVIVFTGFYLVIFRQDFRFPHALVLLPIGVVAIWAFNILRIATLILVGAEISPELALGGFHSLAGWISFVLVTVCVLLVAHSSSVFSRSTHQFVSQPVNLRMALLIPLVVLLSTTLLTAAFTITVDWWYPLRVLFTAAALIFLWPHYRTIAFRFSWVAVAAGVLVFLLWLWLVPDDKVANVAIEQQLREVPFWLQMVWLVCRTVGAIVTVPLAEELAFRGYLFELLGTERNGRRWSSVPWLALLVSSILFGLLHSFWLAGLLAGVAFGLVRFYRGNVADAFVAHATTNGLLSIYVLSTGSWSLW